MSSSKKFTRSGKKGGGDDNAGNFVFSFPGSNPPNPTFNYGGSAPSSPLGSPTAFGNVNSGTSFPGFGTTPSSPSASSSVFVFGGGGTSSTPASPSLDLRRSASEIAPKSPISEVSDYRRANTVIGSPSSVFTFGSSANSSATSANTLPVNNNTTTTTTTTTTTGSSVFNFGATTSQPFSPTVTSANTNAASMTAPASSSTGTLPFSFGSSTNTTPAKPTTSSAPFTFGTTPSSGATAPSSTGISFNPPTQNTSSTATPTPSFGSPAAPTTTSTSSPFSFGGSSSASSFGQPSTPQKADTNTTSNTAGTTSPFSFKPSVPSSSTTTTPISSGSSLSSAPVSAATPTFSFGTSTATTGTAEKKDDTAKKTDTPASSTSTSTPSFFSFGSTTPSSTTTTSTGLPSFSATPATTTTSTTAATTTIATPAPVATSSGPNQFSFSTILENLEKTATQPPNQIGAALVTPSLNALRQNQVVTHTNFRIDNILPSTRYTELPEQARKELDELDRYIHGESQRCDYIAKHASPKRQETMKDTTHEQELLTSKLNSISSSLQIQVNATEELFDSLKEQIRHFSDGQSVIESCKNPGDRSARWLFGYGVDDDYFVNLSRRLASRLEEYKKCIREIEFTTESWTKNRAQSPQDIARIMESQNQTFLAMTNKVAALHERLNLEQDLYTQYRLQAITL